MTTYREINDLQRDTKRAAALAKFLLGLTDVTWDEWQEPFLEGACRWGRLDMLSTRQAEKLIAKIDGLSVESLIRRCFELRFDLPEHDQEYIEWLRTLHTSKVRKGQAYRLLRCAKTLDIIEQWQGGSLGAPVYQQLETEGADA
jgi:hypothetical protein